MRLPEILDSRLIAESLIESGCKPEVDNRSAALAEKNLT
jgi:hypothetical protein